jgi:hypothetical protein
MQKSSFLLERMLTKRQWRSVMKLLTNAIANLTSFLRGLRFKALFAFVLSSWLLVTASPALAAKNEPLGERALDRIHQADKRSERPKTTGELLDEARGDIPLGERVKNITRDSKEAFGQLGQEFKVGAQEGTREVKKNAERTFD